MSLDIRILAGLLVVLAFISCTKEKVVIDDGNSGNGNSDDDTEQPYTSPYIQLHSLSFGAPTLERGREYNFRIDYTTYYQLPTGSYKVFLLVLAEAQATGEKFAVLNLSAYAPPNERAQGYFKHPFTIPATLPQGSTPTRLTVHLTLGSSMLGESIINAVARRIFLRNIN